MKTKMIISAATLMLFTSITFASAPHKVLTLQDSFGRTLTMPVADEEPCCNELTVNLHDIFKQTRLEEVNQQIDISAMVKPESEVNDIPENLRDMIR